MADKVDFCGVAVNRLTGHELLRGINRAIHEHTILLASYIHLNTVNLVGARPQIRSLLASFDVVIPDGIAVLWSARLSGISFRRDRILTTYEVIMPIVVSEGIRKEWTFFLLGAEPGIAARAADTLRKAFPDVRIIGTHHGYISTQDEMEATAAIIARAKPTILLVGMGQPKQEEWILRYADKLGARVIFAVGGYFDKLARGASIYPVWVKRTELYWLYRLFTERKRLWRRYTFGVLLFVWNVLRLHRRAGSFENEATPL